MDTDYSTLWQMKFEVHWMKVCIATTVTKWCDSKYRSCDSTTGHVTVMWSQHHPLLLCHRFWWLVLTLGDICLLSCRLWFSWLGSSVLRTGRTVASWGRQILERGGEMSMTEFKTAVLTGWRLIPITEKYRKFLIKKKITSMKFGLDCTVNYIALFSKL